MPRRNAAALRHRTLDRNGRNARREYIERYGIDPMASEIDHFESITPEAVANIHSRHPELSR